MTNTAQQDKKLVFRFDTRSARGKRLEALRLAKLAQQSTGGRRIDANDRR